ncbi:MAG: hypothetical protein HZB29_09535 [Nitrospinae bacterium]|nr:hypothetical protein [Nitrospinota bacterium]
MAIFKSALTAPLALAIIISASFLASCEPVKENVVVDNGTYGYSSVTTVSLPPGVVKQSVTIPGVETGSTVSEVIFESSGQFYVDGARSSGATYFDWDYSANSVSGSYPDYYSLLWSSTGTTMSFMAPVSHTLSDSYPSGDYEFFLTNPNSFPIDIAVYRAFKRESDFASGSLSLNFFVYTVGGAANSVIPSETDIGLIKSFMNSVLAQSGVTIGAINVEFRDDPTALSLASDMSGLSSFLYQASLATAGRSDTGINCFLLPSLPEGLVGMDGAIPGPGFLHGTGASGLVALAGSLGYVFPGYTDHESDQIYLALTLAHEIGHYLGLYHPSESDGGAYDPLSDTPECGPDNDTDGDGIVSGPECRGKGTEYLMFWTDDSEYLSSGNFQTLISPQQGQVINTHPSIL